MKSNAIKLVAACALISCSKALFAHEINGLQGTHWHATDTAGFAVFVGLAAAAIWLSRK